MRKHALRVVWKKNPYLLDAQSYRHESMVVDDGSTNNTVKLVKEVLNK